MRSPILLALLLAPLAESFAQQMEGFPPDDPDSWRVAGTAKVFCSALFVSGRDSAEVRNHLSAYFLGAKVDSITSIQVDRQRKLVRLTLANRITREAKQYGDQGCVIHQPGKDTVFFKPVRVTTALPDASTMPWPMGDVLSDLPLPAEIDTAKLRQAVDAAFATPAGLTAAFVVVHKGRIVAERYANGAHKEMQLESWSMGKSITGTLIGLLIQQGALRLEDAAPVPEWRKTPNDPRAKIRVMDLMRMSSGLRFSRGSPEDIPGYHDHDLIYTGAIDAFQFVTTRPLQFEPNTFGRYRNTDPLTLGLLIRDAVRKRGEEYLTWPQRALFDKIGIRRQVLETDPYGNFLLSGYDYGTGRNWARLGLLYLNDGVWLGERLLPEGFVKFVSTPAPAWRDTSYGGMVWVNGRGTWNLPRDAFAFRGAGGQETYVVPSRDLVIVRMGHFPGARAGSADFQRAHVLLMEAIPPSSASNLAITNVAVVDGTNSVARAGQTVVIRGNRIVAVTPSASARVPAGARVVDGRGKFLIPGLWDMHVHTAIIGGRDILALYVANGVTGVRDMAGDWATIGEWRRDIAAGRLVGPRIVASGPYLEGGDVPIPHILVRNADEARAGVDSLVRLGVPFIKVHTQLRPETYFAIARRARERGIAFAGHVPNSVGARAASDSGQRSIEHMLAIPAPCTPAESLALRPRFPVQAALGRCSSRDLAPLYEAFVRNRTWVTPTFAAAYEIASWPQRALPGDSLAHYLPDTLRRFVAGIFPMPDSIPPGADSVGHAMLAKRMAQVVTMHRAGVGILTGTDAPLRNSPPGFGLHEELVMLARAGLSPFEIIRAATLEPARYFEMTDSAGTIARGQLADLVLLDANPLADIRNARRIAAVILNGRLVDAAERRRLLNSAAERRP